MFVGRLRRWTATRFRVKRLSRYTLYPGKEAFIAQRLVLVDRYADVAEGLRGLVVTE